MNCAAPSKYRSALIVALFALFAVRVVGAAEVPCSLWIGTDNAGGRPVINIDLVGNLLQSVGPVEITGIAFDPARHVLYLTSDFNTGVTLDLASLTTVSPNFSLPYCYLGEDAAWDGAYLWSVCINGGSVSRVDVSTGIVVGGFHLPEGFSNPMGIAWDGTNLWVSEYSAGGRVKQFTTSGVATGAEFATGLAPGGATYVAPGGLAYSPEDQTFFLGTWGAVYHYSKTGTLLGTIPLPVQDGRFVDGLEFIPGCNATPTQKRTWGGLKTLYR